MDPIRSTPTVGSDGAIDENTLYEISGTCEGNAGMALQTLRMLARSSKFAVSSDHLRVVSDRARRHYVEESLGTLNEKQRMILGILKDHKGIPSGDLFRIYRRRSKHGANDRSYRNYMAGMKQMGLVREFGNTKARMYEAVI